MIDKEFRPTINGPSTQEKDYRPLDNEEMIIRGDEWIDGSRTRWIVTCCWLGWTPNRVNAASMVTHNRAWRRKLDKPATV